MAAKQGLNLVIESRDAEGKTERFGELAAELVRLKVDVIVASNPAATFAAKRATTSIPIVMVNTPDPVLRSRDEAFPHERDGHRLGADAFGGPSRGRHARYSAPHDDANGVAGTVQPHGSLA